MFFSFLSELTEKASGKNTVAIMAAVDPVINFLLVIIDRSIYYYYCRLPTANCQLPTFSELKCR
jgi:hypothetical protein